MGAPINEKDSVGQTALHYAVCHHYALQVTTNYHHPPFYSLDSSRVKCLMGLNLEWSYFKPKNMFTTARKDLGGKRRGCESATRG